MAKIVGSQYPEIMQREEAMIETWNNFPETKLGESGGK